MNGALGELGARVSGAADRLSEHPRREQIAVAGLIAAAFAYAVVVLVATRDTIFTSDELRWFGDLDGYSADAILKAHNGHLIAITRAYLTVSVDLFGPEQLPIRLMVVASTIGASAVVYLAARRRVGPLIALAPAVLLMFLGSTWEPIQPSAASWSQTFALGLAGLLALERGTRRWDVAAAALFVLSILAFEIGIVVVIGAGLLLLSRTGGWRRLWALMPALLLFAFWWLGYGRDDATQSFADQALLTPAYALDSLAAAAAALAGVALDFDPIGAGPLIEQRWGEVLAAGLIVLLFVRFRRVGLTPLAVAVGGALIVLWLGSAVNALALLRPPEAARYAFPVGMLLLVLGAEALRGIEATGRNLLVATLALILTLPGNLFLLRDRGQFLQTLSADVEARLAGIELARGSVDPSFNGGFRVPVGAGPYLESVDRYGSPAISTGELPGAPAGSRAQVDVDLAEIYDLRLEPYRGRLRGCSRDPAGAGRPVRLPPGGAVVVSDSDAEVSLRRFGDGFEVPLAPLVAGEARLLEIPTDASPEPWEALIVGAGRIRVCEPPG